MTDLLFEQALRLRSGEQPTRTAYLNFNGVLTPLHGSACVSANHYPAAPDVAPWTCSCGRTVCATCEGGDEMPELCDVCWRATR